MADKLTIGSVVVAKMQHQNRRVGSAYRADTKGQVFPFTPPLPIIDLVDPATAQKVGGGVVTITGAYFSTTSAVKFGGVNALGFTIVNSTTITATVPALPVGSAPVVVTNVTGASQPYAFEIVDRMPAQRIYKSGSQGIGYFSWVPITGMVADTEYPAAVVVSNGIAVKGGVQLLLEAQQTRNGTNGGNAMRLVDTEGTIIVTQGSGALMTLQPMLYTPPVDTVISMQGYAGSGVGGNSTVPSGTDTYILITPQ